jgi:dTDP-4-dehydrorhamnose 3,5-epimerase
MKNKRFEKLINGVKIKKLKPTHDERGYLMKIFRSDEKIFTKFGQVYITTTHPGVVKAWHYYKKQTDNFAVVRAPSKVALFDNREDSPTKGMINEFITGSDNPLLIQIPKMVYHGLKCISKEDTMVINIPTQTYNYKDPDEFRIDPLHSDIPYNC